MALKRNERYPGRYSNPTSDHPQGAFKNRTAPSAQDGSYLEQDWSNDWDGFFGRLLTLGSITPNGNVDTALDSQYYTALIAAVKNELGTAAQRNVGTSGAQIPDMSSFAASDSANRGWYILPNNHIHQHGIVTLDAVGKFNPQTIGGATYYTRYYVVTLPRSYTTAHQVITVTIAGRSFDNQGGIYGLWAACNRNTDSSGPSLTSFTVSVTSIDSTQVPIIHFSSEGY